MSIPFNRWLIAPFGLAALVLMLVQPAGISGTAAAGGALALMAVGLWATRFTADHLTALLFFVTAMIFDISDAETVFSGFSAGAFWLLFGGMILGSAVGRTGLGQRIARRMALRLGVSYTGLLIGIAVVALALSFVMPSSTGRAVLLMPVAVSLAEAFRFDVGSKGRSGIVITAAIMAIIPGFAILPANVPNLVMIGAADTVYGLRLTYAEYLLLHFPVLGLVKAAMIVAVTRLMFPDRLPDLTQEPVEAEPMSQPEKRLGGLLLVALTLWATDFLHGIQPSWIALAAGIACFLPPFRLIDADKIADAIQIRPLLFIAAVLSLGPVAMATGFAEWMAAGFLEAVALQPGNDLTNFLTLSLATTATSMLGTAPTVPAVWTPLAEGLATATGIPLKSVVMLQAVGFSTLFLPYQVPPMVVALQLGGAPFRQGTLAVLAVGVLSVLILLPLDYLWWQLLGAFDG